MILKIKEFAKISSGNTPLRSNINDFYMNGVIPWVKTMDLNNGKITKTNEKITLKAAGKCKPYKRGTVLVAMYGGFNQIGRTGILDIEASINQAISAIEVNKSLCDPEYLIQYLNKKVSLWRKFAASSRKDPNITSKDVGDFDVYLPPLPEQRAIADILSTWDTAIEKMERLIEAKEKRFKEKSEIFITEMVTSHKDILLGDICEIFTAGSKSSEIVQTGKYIIADMGAISGKGELLDRKRSNNNKDLLNIGDLIMPKDDIGGGNIIGKVAYVSIDSVVLGDHVYALRFKENVNSKFIYYQINGRRINRQLRRMSNGTSQLGLGKKDVKIQKIFLPDKNEQNRIANILDNLKREIVLLGQIKIYYKEQKRGLMQKLLTGAWRVGV